MAKNSNLWAFRAPKPMHQELDQLCEEDIRTPSSLIKYLCTLGLEAHKAKKINQEKTN